MSTFNIASTLIAVQRHASSGSRGVASRLVIGLMVVFSAWLTTVHAAIPSSERAVLTALYVSANGAAWGNSAGWNGIAGSECTWAGVTCSVGDANVTALNLSANNLTGSLPATLNDLTQLRTLSVSNNQLTGTIPSFSGMTQLANLVMHNNQFSGSVPALSGAPGLSYVTLYNNLLTGSMPSLTGLTQLQYFYADRNQFSGALPSLAGLTQLVVFYAYGNMLTGTLPALDNLTALESFYVYGNQLSGSIPAFVNVPALRQFDVSANQLTGAIPSLAGVSALRGFRVHDNALTGAAPAVPSPVNLLSAGGSRLCPNALTPSVSAAWDAATGSTPWSVGCGAPFTVSQTSSLDFGVVSVATPGAGQDVVLTNTSANAGSIVSCAFSGTNAAEFLYEAPAPTFPIALGGGQSVNISVYPLATGVGAKTAALTCTLSPFGTITGGPTALIANAPVPTLTQTAALAFNTVNVGITSPNLNVALTNSSAVTAQVASCTIGGANASEFAFNPAPNFPMFIGTGATRNIAVNILATSTGAKSATVTCMPAAQSVITGGPTPMTATADPPPVSSITQSSALAFGTVFIGVPSVALNLNFTNSAAAAGAIQNCVFGGANAADFAFSPPPSFPVQMTAGQTINFSVSVLASTIGSKAATITCTPVAPGSLSGGPTALTANAASINQTASLAFGTVAVSVPSPNLNVVLMNPTAAAASVLGCSITGVDATDFAFNPTPTFPLVVPPNGASVNLPVRITAASPGEKSASVVCTPAVGVQMSGPTELTASTDRGCLDADGDGKILAHTDVLMLERAARGLTGTAVTNGAIFGAPPRNTWALIRAYLNSRCNTNYAP